MTVLRPMYRTYLRRHIQHLDYMQSHNNLLDKAAVTTSSSKSNKKHNWRDMKDAGPSRVERPVEIAPGTYELLFSKAYTVSQVS